MEHINESILSEEIKEHQKEARIDHMVYLPGMEALKSDITKQVVEAMEAYDYDSYTAGRCKMCLGKKKPHTGRFCGAAVAGGRTVYRRDGTVCKSGKRKSFWQFGLFFYAALYCQLL